MAIVSSHTLNSVDGTHAGGIAVALWRLEPGGDRTALFETTMDAGGRLSETVALADGDGEYELVFQTGAYFTARNLPVAGPQILREVVIRFAMPDPAGRYHLPLMLAPNSYSLWWSA